MMKKIYIASWLILALALLVSIFTGALTSPTLFIYSLLVLGLVYVLALWLLVVNTRKIKT